MLLYTSRGLNSSLEGDKMLITSFIFAAGLELVIIYNSIASSSWSLVWAYGFLFIISLFSVQAEDSKSGKAARNFFKLLGIKSEKYDITSNIFKIIIYILVLAKIISYYIGAALAYLVVFITVTFIYTKYIDVLRGKKNRDKEKEQKDENKNKE